MGHAPRIEHPFARAARGPTPIRVPPYWRSRRTGFKPSAVRVHRASILRDDPVRKDQLAFSSGAVTSPPSPIPIISRTVSPMPAGRRLSATRMSKRAERPQPVPSERRAPGHARSACAHLDLSGPAAVVRRRTASRFTGSFSPSGPPWLHGGQLRARGGHRLITSAVSGSRRPRDRRLPSRAGFCPNRS